MELRKKLCCKDKVIIELMKSILHTVISAAVEVCFCHWKEEMLGKGQKFGLISQNISSYIFKFLFAFE